MAGETNQTTYQTSNPRQMIVLVRYKPAGLMAADDMLGGITSKVDGVVGAIEDAAASIPGLSLFFKEEKEPEKKCDKEYNYYKEYQDWDKYINKLKDDYPEKLNNPENEVLVHDFDVEDANGRKNEGKTLSNKIKGIVSGWKNYTGLFHFIGIGQGGNVANECINELCKEADFKKKWHVQSVFYIGTPLYKNIHALNEKDALQGKGKIYSYGNAYDLTQQAIAYFEPNDKLVKMIAESNANTLSVFTGKIKAQLVSTLGRLLSIGGFGTGHDNTSNIKKLTDCKDDAVGLVSECVDACKNVMNAFPDLIKPPDLPKFDQMLNGFDSVPDKSKQRLEKFIDELKQVRSGVGFDTSKLEVNKFFNFLCPLVDQLTESLKLFTLGSETSNQAFDKIMDKAGVKKILAPAKTGIKTLPVDPYIEKVVEMAKEAQKKMEEAEKEQKDGGGKTQEQVLYDQANIMISTCTGNIAKATDGKDVDVSALNDTAKAKVAEAITAMVLPMMPSKKKFYGTLLQYIPLDGLTGFMEKLTADAAMAPLKNLMGNVKSNFDFDEGTKQEPGLKKSLANFDKELSRIKGFLNKNNYPVHKDANSLYFIYNSHNIMLKKPWGEILYTIDKATGYLDAMQRNGYANFHNLEKNEYQGGAAANGNIEPVKVLEEEGAATS